MDKTRQVRLAKDAMDRDWADPGLDLDTVAAHAGYSARRTSPRSS